MLPWIKSPNNKISVAVLGDIILDEYLEGEVNRISPEAPVPVHLVTRSILRAGGAANAALNIQCAGGQAVLFGVCGSDRTGDELFDLLQKRGVQTDLILRSNAIHTTRKTRISAQHHQIVRVDWERHQPLTDYFAQQILDRLEREEFNAILISDYGKGGLTPQFIAAAIQIAHKKNVPVVVDPKGTDFSRYKGASIITPNRKEALAALGIDSSNATELTPVKIAQSLQEKFNLEGILLTLGAQGMLFHSKNASSPSDPTDIHLATAAREVFDVSGAGDTVAAVLALGLASRCAIPQALRLANLAAGIVVGKWGTHPVEQFELEDAWSHHIEGKKNSVGLATRSAKSKIQSAESLEQILSSLRRDHKKIVMTNGCFDLLHAGHTTYLEKARSLGDILVVALNSDASVRSIKGPTRPIVRCEDRAMVLASLEAVDFVTVFDEDTPMQTVSKLRPDILVKGADWDPSKIVGSDVVKSYGGTIATVELVADRSTSSLVQRIKNDESAFVESSLSKSKSPK